MPIGSEYRNFLLYYGVFVLEGILPTDYLIHFGFLSASIRLLSKDCITPDDLTTADRLLGKFYFLHKELYGLENCTMNVHVTSHHLVSCVRLAGPLWATSTFPMESNLGQLVKMIRGSRNVGFEMVCAFLDMQKSKLMTTETDSKHVFQKLSSDIHVPSRRRTVIVPGAIRQALLEAGLPINPLAKVITFTSIKLNGERFYSAESPRVTKRCSYYVETEYGIAKILRFMQLSAQDINVYAVTHDVEVNGIPGYYRSAAKAIQDFGESLQVISCGVQSITLPDPLCAVRIIPVKKIKHKLMLLSVDQKNVVCSLPNQWELD
ncbi:PREDICTED: uncharacterized protein LOC106806616 isoform X2 [Priapulus caudatus]|uniref:Uncharacterized protein LOC106806616 isoform X2 n=1 Tax=Priapulus caudatus TaxID=37621 RepID=A0ABM1DVY2_PRICU|nr:PREDICTED: uncharacterized protein LOC106806616 isoform X2 [Priapulus caudatus]